MFTHNSYFRTKTAVVTGGADGIGKAAAYQFAAAGARVVIWDTNEALGIVTAQAVSDIGARCSFEKVNVAEYSEVERATQKATSTYGSIEILINNAGITRDSTLKKMSPEQWKQVIDVNLTGVFNCAKCIGVHMLEKGFGRIINTSSVVGLYGNFGQVNYAATKAGVIGLTKTLAKELGKKGITVNAVAPGFVATAMVRKMPAAVLKNVEEKVPTGRLGTPEEIAAVYLFLASEWAAYINGAVLSVDGGLTL